MKFAKLYESDKLGQILVTLAESKEELPAISIQISQKALILESIYIFETKEQQEDYFKSMDQVSAEAIAIKLLPERKVVVDKPKGLLN